MEPPRTPTEQYQTRKFTPIAPPLEKDPTLNADGKTRWKTAADPVDPAKPTDQELKERRHVQLFNQGESRQTRSANNANRQHDQRYEQATNFHQDNFKQRGKYYATNIEQRDWYYTNSLHLRKMGEEQRQRHQDDNYEQREAQQKANFDQREAHQKANFDQRENHQTINFNQREAHQRQNVNQRWWQSGIQAGTTVVTGIGLGVGTYALRQSVSNDQTAQGGAPTKRFNARDESQNSNGGGLGKRFFAHAAPVSGPAGNVRLNNQNLPDEYPDYMATIQPDDKRPVKHVGENGLTPEEIAQLGQPRDNRPHVDIEVPHSGRTPGSDPAAKPDLASEPRPTPGSGPGRV